MVERVIKRSRWKTGLAFIGFAGLTYLSVAMFLDTKEWKVFLMFPVFVYLTMRLAIQTFSPKPWMVLHAEGFSYYGNPWKPLHVKWTEIQWFDYREFNAGKARRVKCIDIVMKDRETFLSQYSIWTRWGVQSNFWFGISGEITLSLGLATGISYKECIDLMSEYHCRANS